MKKGQMLLRGATILLAAVMFFYAATWVGIQLFGDDDRYLNPEKAKVVSPLGATIGWEYHIPNTGDYAAGVNTEGKPVFVDPHRAIKAFKREHRLYFIKIGLHLGPVFFGPKNWKRFQEEYWTAAPKVWGEIDGDRELYDFLRVYGNSFDNFV